jgi:hypothetical protein
MRCQWGTTWENLQPWIAARRFREFEVLDVQLKAKFPTLASSLLTLPQKDFFRSLESDVVQKRRQALEDYMSKIVSSVPSVCANIQYVVLCRPYVDCLVLLCRLFARNKLMSSWA